MRVLILTCNTGEGHNSASAAVCEALELRGHVCDTVDALGFLSKRASAFICRWHVRLYRYAPKLFDTGYAKAEKYALVFEERGLLGRYLSSGGKKLEWLLDRARYDAIICAHAFPAMMVTDMMRRRPRNLRTIFIATDYTCGPVVEDTDLETYCIPHPDLAEQFLAAGIPAERLAPIGIPVRQAFYQKWDKTEARRALGIPEGGKLALLMCGSMGCGPLEELTGLLAKRLPAGAMLTVVCGTNAKLLETLRAREWENVRVLGFTKEMPLWLSAADLFLTKPGGLSVSEAGTAGTPLLLLDAVGGCETPNLRFFTQRGWADAASSPEDMALRCAALLEDDALLDRRSSAMREAFSHNAAQALVDLLTTKL